MKEKGIALLIALAAWIGCAAQAPPPDLPASGERPASKAPRAEEFDPLTLREKPLLIQPNFPPPIAATPPLPVPGQAALPGRQVFRLQLMALSNGAVAAQRRDELERQLGLPVRVVHERQLFMVRAGAFSTAAAAEGLKRQVAELSREYLDAYVVVDQEPLAPAEPARKSLADPAVAPDPAATSAPLPRLAPSFGWRVRLDKVESYQQAQALQQQAVKLLGRPDIDITFTTPYYNVELGHYRTQTQAQEALDGLRDRYPNALIVRGQILVPAEE